jgi:hypothetical protein
VGGRVVLSWLEFDVLWEHLRLGPVPPVLAVPSPGRTHHERAALRDQVWPGLAAKDLERLASRLTALARPEWEVDVRMPPTSALVARSGRHATVAVRTEGEMTLSVVPADRFTTAAVRVLPAHPAGSTRSVRVPASTVDEAVRARHATTVLAAAVGTSDARRITDLLANVTRFAHFGAARTPPGGARVRGPHVVSVYDTPPGRYLFTRRDGWVTLLPGTETAITRQVEELVALLG